MYKKVCCKCEVVALPFKPIVSLAFSLPLRCQIVKALNNSQVRYYGIRNSFLFSRNGLFSDGQKMGKRYIFSFNLGLWVCQCTVFCDNLKGTILFVCSVQLVICTWIGFPETTNADKKRSIEPQLLWQEKAQIVYFLWCYFQAGCTVVAVFLHYFLLALFSWMLCEGVLLYILLVKVFGGGAEEKVKYFYIFGWGR